MDISAQFEPLSEIPIIAALLMVGVIGVLVLIYALTKTKTATDEARIGQYELILLPSGKVISGLATLARKLVSPEFTFDLSRSKTITKDHAKKLQETFDKLHFYAIRGSSGKVLIISSKNLEDPEFAIVVSEKFTFPFGYMPRRLVVGDATETKRTGWKVITIEPRNMKTKVSPKIFETMKDVGEACASVKEAAIRIKKEMPWKEVAKAYEAQLKDAHNEVAKAKGEIGVLRLALGSKPLFGEEEVPIPKVSVGREGLLTFWRVAASVFLFFVMFSFLPTWLPTIITDPLLPSIAIGVLFFILYPRLVTVLKRVL